MYQLLNLYKQSFSNIQKNIWILSIATFINRSGAMVLLFASLYFTKELHFSISQAGIIMSFYGIGSVLGAFIGGWLSDRKNFINVMLLSLLLSGAILLLLLISKTIFSVSIVIFFYALTADVFRPASSKAIAVFSSSENRTRSVSLVRLAINLGFSAGPAIGGFMAVYIGYKWLFVLDAITSVLAAVMLYFYLPSSLAKRSTTTNQEENIKSVSAYSDVTFLFFIAFVALYGICFFQLFAGIPQYFDKVCHYNEDKIGLLMALNGLLVVIIEMPFIVVLEKYKTPFRFILIGCICLPVSFFVLQLGNCLTSWAIVYTLIITFSEMFAMPFMFSYSLSRASKDRQGQYSALYSIAWGIANIFAPSFGLGIADAYGFQTMLYSIVILGIIITIGFFLLKKYNRAS